MFKLSNIFNRNSKPHAEIPKEEQKSSNNGNSILPGWLGLPANEQKAMTVSAFFRGIDTLSSDIAKLSVSVSRNESGQIQKPNHSLNFLLRQELDSSSVLTNFEIKKRLVIDAILRGNGYLLIIKNSVGGVVRTEYKKESDVMPLRWNNEVWYRVNGYKKAFHWLNVVHIKGFPSMEIEKGSGVIRYAAESMGISLGAQKFGSSFFQNGGTPSGVISTEKKVDKKDKKNIADQWNNKFSRQGVGSIGVLDQGFEYERVTVTPEEAQFLQTREFGVEDVARWLNMPVYKLHKAGQQSYNSLEMLSTDYVKTTLLPWVIRIEEELTRKLFSIEERKAGFFVDIDLKSEMRADSKTRTQNNKDLFFIGAISPNEIREREGLHPREDGDEYFTPVNMQTQEQIDKMLERDE